MITIQATRISETTGTVCWAHWTEIRCAVYQDRRQEAQRPAEERLVRTKKAVADGRRRRGSTGVGGVLLRQDKPITIEQLKTEAEIEEGVFDDTLLKGCSSPSNTKGAYGKIWVVEDQTVVLNPNLRDRI